MIQKVLKVGTSAAVTIPKKSLKELGLKIGDSVAVTVNVAHKRLTVEPSVAVDRELVTWTDSFIKKYKPALKALASK
ncbi:MAG: AbrB/MazE/SpoVT family DNA-binding domain-containing protein [Patescibacteria group bacterium]|nr:AbrB/MazE/SpoVT family DNA-binding domain-containing protein [Patescibacteria group bacterium]